MPKLPPSAWRLTSPLCFGLAVVALLWVAIYNRYPLVWWDSGTYIDSSLLLGVPASRPVFYGLFLRATHWRVTLWATVVVQSLLAVYLIRVILDDQDRASRTIAARDAELLVICVCLAVVTALPWLVGWIMADVFTGVAVLCLYDLLLPRPSGHFRLGVPLLLIGSLLVHFAHVPLLLGVTALLQLAAWAGLLRLRDGALRIAWACMAVALMVFPLTSWTLTGSPFAGGSGHVFLLGRLFSNRTVQQLLAEHCDDRDYELCAYRDALPQSFDEYLWSPTSPLKRMGGWQGSGAESWRVIRDGIAAYPWTFVRSTLRGIALQLRMFDTAANLPAFREGTSTNDAVRRDFAHEYERYRAARQQVGQLRPEIFRRVDWWAMVASAAFSIAILAAAVRNGWTETVQLHGLVWSAIVVNAVIVATFNEPHHRFGARVGWLLPLSVLLSLTRYVNSRSTAARSF